jgi:hypothetical protein
VPYKDKAVKKAKDSLYKKSYYLLNKEAIKARVARNKRLGKAKWIEFKSSQPCHHCGASHPAIIDFHHVVRDGTQGSVNRMAADSNWARVYEEVKKCIPLCSNCHRILHWNESRGRMITKDMTGKETSDDDDSSAA